MNCTCLPASSAAQASTCLKVSKSIAPEQENVASKPPLLSSSMPIRFRSLYARDARSKAERDGAYLGGSRTMISNVSPASLKARSCLLTSDCMARCLVVSSLLSLILSFSVSIARPELSTLVTDAAPLCKAFSVNPPV